MTVRYADVIRAEVNGNDLIEDDQSRIRVYAENEEGKLCELGWVSGALVLQDPAAAHRAIERIKWARFRHKKTAPEGGH